MKPTVRKIQLSDIPQVLMLLRDFAGFENLTEYCTATDESFQAAMFGQHAVVEGLIAFDQDTPIGYSLFYPNFSSFRGQRGFHLEDIYIKSEYRRTGVGETMLRDIARIAAVRGFERIDFFVLDWNVPAISFYKKLGAESNDEETHFKFSDKAFEKLASQ